MERLAAVPYGSTGVPSRHSVSDSNSQLPVTAPVGAVTWGLGVFVFACSKSSFDGRRQSGEDSRHG
jgi:hypothetical protein